MARKIFGLGVPVLVLAFGFAVIGCDNGTTDNNNNNNPSDTVVGIWEGSLEEYGYSARVEIKADRSWTMQGTWGSNDAGTYTMDGSAAILRSTLYDMELGRAVIIDYTTISLVLNSGTFAPGSHTLKRIS